MTEADALDMIKRAIEEVSEGAGDQITTESDLEGDDILDSLDLMNFLFELEQLNGAKIEGIDENFSDFRVSKIIELMQG